jgi:heptosyltransferase-2
LQYPNIKIDFCVLETLHQAIQYNPYINKIILYSKDEQKLQSFRTSIAEANYDVIIDLQNNLRSHKLLSPFKAKVRRFKKSSFKKWLLVNFKINLLQGMPPIPQRYANVIPEISLDNKGLDLFLPENLTPKLNDDAQYIGFCPGSKHYTKMWPHENYSELGEILFLHKYKVVLFGGKDDKAVCDLIASTLPEAINLCNNDDLFDIGVNMKKCKVIIGNDSGLMHVATAVNVPVISIFGSTVTDFGFAPYKANAQVVQIEGLSCRPCTHVGRDTCPKKDFQCMLRITPATIFQQLNNSLV